MTGRCLRRRGVFTAKKLWSVHRQEQAQPALSARVTVAPAASLVAGRLACRSLTSGTGDGNRAPLLR